MALRAPKTATIQPPTNPEDKTARRPEHEQIPFRAVESTERTPYSGPDSTGASLLELLDRLPRWAGDDLYDLLDEVKRMRGEARF
ncbi:MAG: hypothetical protein ACRDJW_08900 [Thermomicrobiales bacterium]